MTSAVPPQHILDGIAGDAARHELPLLTPKARPPGPSSLLLMEIGERSSADLTVSILWIPRQHHGSPLLQYTKCVSVKASSVHGSEECM
jgi:hypothetical protein